ncbi:hypothetical protein MVEN_00070600 [Mycena venus]|uniref:Uncharacterized protein n=1 Tax=Mycena venus TaxID=2733690 RepID=A0A8H7DH74_9AGAR|nr:hypothetical protein MVEN_00070600 [Mycena venus]
MSRRTVARAVNEGGKYGELQLRREIMDAPGFIESSDGTTHRGLTVESRHITLLMPSYDLDVDDSDRSTWTSQTRFIEVAPALDHTAQRQFEGTLKAAGRIADTYSRTPLATQNNRTMDTDDYHRKKMGENKDHAADGKKGFGLSAAHKKDIDESTGFDRLFSSEGWAKTSFSHSVPTPEAQQNKCTHIFGGCCCHKDLNVVKYGYHAVQNIYDKHDIPPPVLLANKSNAATIDLGANDPDSAADKAAIFVQERKRELYGLEEPTKFPDVSNTRYGCYTYAAAEVVCFHGIIQELVEQIIDAKTKSGTELVALALYGVSVSWPYMTMVRGPKEAPVNLLDLTDLHRKLPVFCSHLASNPHIILDPTTSLELLTINGRPFMNNFLFAMVDQLRPRLPHLFLVISTMFSGCETGWIQFTPEFHVGGTFDRLTPLQRSLLLLIPATNDRNEGMLGSYWQHMKHHPNSTAQSFSNQIRWERNDTQAFIRKFCDDAILKFVMREIRKDGASGQRAMFR